MLSWYYFSLFLLTLALATGYFEFIGSHFMDTADYVINDNLQRPVVRIRQGKIEGLNLISRSKRPFFGFQGIPYAQPPVGNLRFKAPVPATPWNGTLDGGIISSPCPQVNGTKLSGNEDCLHLNVFTPQLPVNESSKLLPVLVFIFGGGYSTGMNNPLRYGPQFMLDKDVLLVTPNYRTGVLGYLSTGDEISPGNYGLKDLVLALEWIRDNIRHFGGDPHRVTIMGGSSGAISVHLLALSDLTKGLFHGYITESGSALFFAAYHPIQDYKKLAPRIAEHFGCPTNTSAALVDCLRGFDALQLVNTDHLFQEWLIFPRLVWGPTIEPEMEGALLTDTPANLVAAGKIRDLPWLDSVTRDEGILFSALLYAKPDLAQEFLDNFDTLAPIMLMYGSVINNVQMFTDAVKSYYLNDLTADKNLLLANITKIIGEGLYVYPYYSAAEQQLIHAKQPHYLASFEYEGIVSYSFIFSGGSTTKWGVAHGDELLYLLPGLDTFFGPAGWKFTENDWKMVDTMVQLWTSFVINGAPSIPGSNVVWEPYSSRRNYLRIGNGPDTTLEVGYNLLSESMRFWKELYASTSWRYGI